MKKIKLLILIILILTTTSCTSKEKVIDPIDDNYRVFYEIFVGSFSDSNNDGIGDLQGIINRLDYLNDGDINSNNSLGIQGIWLTPIFKANSYHKYDVVDYYSIDKEFGDQETLDQLIEKAHQRNVSIILDLVINHTSSEHLWFKQFVKAHQENDTSNKYYDYYVYAPKDNTPKNRAFCEILNTDEMYECNFSYLMPELNFDNEKVRKEVLDIAKYYIDKGIDGFRFDAAKYIYFSSNNNSIDFWNWYCDELRKMKEDIYLVGEVWSSDNETKQYDKAMNCFNFTMAQAEGMIASAARGSNINNFTNYVVSFQNSSKNQMLIPFISNHDMDRASGYLNIMNGRAFIGANLYLLLPGSPFIYYGEEIGMKGTRGNANSDANRRLAMLWGDEDTIKDPIEANFPNSKQINGTVKEQSNNENSLLNHYQKLIHIRNKYPFIARGNYEQLNLNNEHVGGFKVTYNDEITYIIHNTSDSSITINDLKYNQIIEVIGLNDASYQNGQLTIGAQTSILIK